jgi:membrane protease YdiL (CAAX protease family)
VTALAPPEPSRAARILRAAPTRLLIYLVALIGIATLDSFGAKKLGTLAGLGKPGRFDLFTAFAVPMSVVGYAGLVRWLERRRASEVAGPGVLRELGLGVLAGAGLFSMTIGIIALLGGYAVTGREPVAVLAGAIAMAIESGVLEELLLRGVVFRVLEEWLGTWAALVLSAALFGAIHLGNPHATAWSATAIAIEAGTLLAAAYMLTRRLWFAMGLHGAWNYTQGAIFGVAVSGNDVPGLLRSEPRGPDWISGGEFGAEASVIAALVCSLAAVAMMRAAIKKDGVVAPSWVRKRRALAASPAG